MKYTATAADRHILYEKAVQNVEFEVKTIERFYQKYRKKKAVYLREDFCGTFSLCCQWVRQNKNYQAIGIDLDRKTLDWGKKHNLGQLKETEQQRIQIIHNNVLNVSKPKVDVVAAFNFSYWIFRNPQDMLNYFRKAYTSLDKDGILILDAFGGPAAETEQEEKRKCDGFTYVWEHTYFHPISREMGCKIHFRFKDKTEMPNAFVYHWRLWTPPEISELLKKAGFRQIDWYMEGTDEESDEGNGIFRLTKSGENAQTWLAYAVAVK